MSCQSKKAGRNKGSGNTTFKKRFTSRFYSLNAGKLDFVYKIVKGVYKFCMSRTCIS